LLEFFAAYLSCFNFLHNYFDPTNLFSDPTKFLDISSKSFYPCILSSHQLQDYFKKFSGVNESIETLKKEC